MMLTEVRQDSRGNTLFVEDNEVGGHRYWSDEIGGGVVVWDTSLVSPEMLRLALAAETPTPSAEQKVGEFTPTHRHYKGGLYQVLHEATDEYGQWKVIVYKAEDGRIWTRQKHVFNEIMPDGQPRFAALPAPPASSQR